ncbi:MAG: signal peptidase II [Turicibacter sp.]|nr:signal peptidase II [Turicibacter sp.]
MMKIVVLIVVLVVALDQVTKQIITRTMEIGDSNPIINHFLYITYHRNSGAAFGILQGQMWFFYTITVIAIISLVIWISKLNMKKEKVLAIALALMLGGAIGNFIDRVVYQAVIDFVHTIWWGHSFPIFNVADVALVCGALLMVLDVIILDRLRGKDLYFEMD